MTPSWLLTAAAGGFFGTLASLAVAYVFVRRAIVRAFEESTLLKQAHDENKCPICQRPMQHDHGAS